MTEENFTNIWDNTTTKNITENEFCDLKEFYAAYKGVCICYRLRYMFFQGSKIKLCSLEICLHTRKALRFYQNIILKN